MNPFKHNIVNASNINVEGSYTKNNPLVSDKSQIIESNIKNITVSLKHIKPNNEFLKKVESKWNQFKKTQRGEFVFSGPIIAFESYSKNDNKTNNNKNLNLKLKLITYKEFFMSYLPDFTREEKEQNYSIGVSSIITTADKYIVGIIRNQNLSSSNGILESPGGFLSPKNMLGQIRYSKILKSCLNGTYWTDQNNETRTNIGTYYLSENDIAKEIIEELGIKIQDIKKIKPLHLLKRELYQNYDILTRFKLNLTRDEIKERYINSDNESNGLVFLDRKKIKKSYAQYKDVITPQFRDALEILVKND